LVIAGSGIALVLPIERKSNLADRREGALALYPDTVRTVDWQFADIACYPARLLSLVRRWLASGRCRRFVFRFEFQGPTDHSAAAAFRDTPGSRLAQRHHSKHELTWFNLM
jgi:23S rRNA (cytidine2498-2'-O)-methyltransferase